LTCGITELRRKEVINVRDGLRIGFVSDVEVDLCNARLIAIIIYGKLKLFGILGREEDIVIRWEHVEVIGKDTILVSFYQTKEKHKGIFGRFLQN
jgi:YlmC/YmxH family sporulation protein